MNKLLQRAPKAYKNLDFLNSPDARIIRMLSEFLEPQRRFRLANVRNTIVFFGSARVGPRKEARSTLQLAQKRIERTRRPTAALRSALHDAEVGYEMAQYYEASMDLARRLTQWSKSLRNPHRFVVCSGGGPGIMEAANKGARLAGGKSVGLNISLPFEQFPNSFITDGLNFEFHYFFMRKFWFAYLAKALVIFPGGFGTMDELMELLTLLQTDKIKKKVAVVIYGSEYWKKVLNFEAMVSHGVIKREDLKLFRYMDSVEDAFEYLRGFLTREYIRKRPRNGEPLG